MDAFLKPLTECLVAILCAAVLWLVKLLITKINNIALRDAIYEAFEQGVSHTQEEFVTWAKRASADGKLTKEERTEAMNKAYELAIEAAKSPKVKKIIESMDWLEIVNVIKNIVVARKSSTQTKT